MPIQLPTVKRMGPAAPVAQGQLNVEAPNFAKATAGPMNVAMGMADKVTEHLDELAADAANTASIDADADYQVMVKTDLQKAKAWDGDPTKIYADMDTKWQEYEAKVMEKYKDSDDRTKRAIQERTARSNHLLKDNRAINHEMQYQSWAQKRDDDGVALRRETLMTTIEAVDVNKPDTFINFEKVVNDIKDLRLKSGIRTGHVDKDSGEIAPSLKLKIKKDLSESISDVVTTLNASGKTAEAAYIMEKYKEDLLGDTRAKLLKDHSDSTIKNEALLEVDKIKHMDPDIAMTQLAKIKNLQVREKAEEYLDAHQRRVKNAEKRAAEGVYEQLADYVSEKRFETVADLRNDPTYAKIASRMDHKQKTAIEEMVEAPKNSNEEVKTKMYDILFKKELRGMSRKEFLKNAAGLNKADRTKFEGIWQKENTQDAGEENAAFRYMGGNLKAQMVAQGLIKQRLGKISDKSQIKVTQYYDELLERTRTLPPGTTIADWQKYLRDFVVEKKTGQAFTREERPKLQGGASPSPSPTPRGSPAPMPTPTPTPVAAGPQFTKADALAMVADFRKETKQIFNPRDPNHQKWATDYRKKLAKAK